MAGMADISAKRRRRFQFSLRSLLIGVTLNGRRTGVPAGLVVRSRSPDRPRETLFRDE